MTVDATPCAGVVFTQARMTLNHHWTPSCARTWTAWPWTETFEVPFGERHAVVHVEFFGHMRRVPLRSTCCYPVGVVRVDLGSMPSGPVDIRDESLRKPLVYGKCRIEVSTVPRTTWACVPRRRAETTREFQEYVSLLRRFGGAYAPSFKEGPWLHSPSYMSSLRLVGQDPVQLPICYWVNRDVCAKPSAATLQYYQNALHLILPLRGYVSEVAFKTALEECLKKKTVDKDVFYVCTDLVLFSCRFITYQWETNVVTGESDDVYTFPYQPDGCWTADCEDFAKHLQLCTYALQSLETSSQKNGGLEAVKKLLSLYVPVITQGAIYMNGAHMNHVWMTLISRDAWGVMTGGMARELMARESWLPKLILEGTSAASQAGYVDIFATTNHWYRYVTAVHASCMRAEDQGHVTDYLLVCEENKTYGMRINLFMGAPWPLEWQCKVATRIPAQEMKDWEAWLDVVAVPATMRTLEEPVCDIQGVCTTWKPKRREYCEGDEGVIVDAHWLLVVA